jgi:GDP-L-fucose synthase
MRIFLTGGRGMVGRNLLEHAAASKHEVYAPTSAELDLRDVQAVDRWLSEKSPDVVIHAAGFVGGIQANLRDPVRFLLDNVDIGRNVIWSAFQNKVKTLINLGSSCMYPRDAQNPLREEMILKGELEPTNESYALAKVFAARLCEYISREDASYRYKTLIPCNIFGRYDRFDPIRSHMVPAIIHKLHGAKTQNKDQVEIWGDGTARREFMYAADLADCIWHAIDHFDSLPATMNVGLGYDYTVDEYYRAAADVIGYKGKFVYDLSKPVGMKQKLVSIERQKDWGWAAKISIHEGLSRTYQFYIDEINCD